MSSLTSRFKQLSKDTVIYGLGGALAKSVGFFLLPVYTRVFTPADYGTIEMLSILVSFLTMIMVMGMDSAQSFYFFEQKSNGVQAQARVVSSILQWRLIWGTAVLVVAMLFAPLLNAIFFSGTISWMYFAVAFSVALFNQLMSQSAEVFRLLYKPLKYICITLFHSLGAAALALVLILVFKKGILGFFLGSLIASIFAAILGWWLIRDYLDWSVSYRNWWPKLLRFGIPLVPSGFAMYVLISSDRWFIISLKSPEELGLYAVGAKFASVMALAVHTFRLAWWPVAMDAMQNESEKPLFRVVGRLYLGLGIASAVLLTAISPLLVRIMAAPGFFQAYPVVGILAWYPILYGFSLIVSCGIWKSEKTVFAPVIMGVAAILNIFLNAWWVPSYGGIGAATATAVSFLIWNILAIYISEKFWKVGYDYLVMISQVFIGALACGMILLAYQDEINWVMGCTIAGVSMVLLGASSISTMNLRTAIRLAFGR